MLRKVVFIYVLLASTLAYGQKFEGLALTPPMGWNSWNKFGCDVSEKLIKEIADAIVSSGMKDAGYEYVVIDDCWQVDRDENGNIVPDPERFPNGMKHVVDYVHSLGLKFGIYSDAGTKTCQGRPGSRGYEFQDARTYVSWGVDYVKYDWCHTSTQDAKASYTLMRDAIYKAGKPIVFSICEWGLSKPWVWAKDVGHLWRTTDDIMDCWDCVDERNNAGFTVLLDRVVGLESYAGPGHWNDPDMLEVGNSGLTVSESRAHFSLWCILAAPLMAGNDLRDMSAETKEILMNKEAIAVDQDAMGKVGVKVRDDGDLEVWVKQLADGSRGVVLFNRGLTDEKMTVKWTEMGYPPYLKALVRDLWQHKDIGKLKDEYSVTVPSHDAVMLRVTPL
jgi:alpha-galactosidase